MSSKNQSLEIKQTNSLYMTQSLQQAIKILQLPTLELRSFLSDEIAKNPLLIEEGDDEDIIKENYEEKIEIAENDDLNDYYMRNEDMYIKINNKAYDNFAENIYVNKTLKDHLLEQIYVEISDDKSRMIALHLTDMLNENGYLECDIESFAQQINCQQDDIENTIFILQQLDPLGVFARSLQECIKIQLKEQNLLDNATIKLIDNIELLAKGDLMKLQKLCNIETDRLKEIVSNIKKTNPKPGANFTVVEPSINHPDVFLSKGGGKWIIELNHDILPKLLINRRYYAEIKAKSNSKIVKKYLTEQLQTANFLIKSLDQRAQTILKVATEIVAKQSLFFDYGVNYLSPMTLSDIARSTGLHESTISRVTLGKYISSPIGNFELKYFFSSSIASEVGDNLHSSRSIKNLIKSLIEEETYDNILSDEKIVQLLKQKNVNIARRTVTKYREELDIEPSSIRRRKKNLNYAFKL